MAYLPAPPGSSETGGAQDTLPPATAPPTDLKGECRRQQHLPTPPVAQAGILRLQYCPEGRPHFRQLV